MNMFGGRGVAVVVAVALVLGLGAGRAAAADTLVDVELSLVVDVSGSITPTQFALQRDGYVKAFESATLSTAIANGTLGSIAVNLVYWSVGQVEAVGWTLVDSTPASMQAFADAIAAAPQPDNLTYYGTIDPALHNGPIDFGTQTGLANAIQFSADGFAANGFAAQSARIIDVSSDGADNGSGKVGFSPTYELMDAEDTARMAAVRLDVLGMPGEATPGALVDIINGLAIGEEINGSDPSDPRTLVQYYKDEVIGVNPNWVQTTLNLEAPGFVVGVGGLGEEDKFNEAVLRKLVGIPEPVTMSLVLIGGIGALVRRYRRAIP